jgi:GTP-binding protein
MKNDMDFINWCGKNDVPMALIFTKADKLKPQQRIENFNVYQAEIQKSWEEMPQFFMTSVIDQSGKIEVISFIHSIIDQISNQ